MKKKILTALGIVLFVFFLTQIKYENLLNLINTKNLLIFILSLFLVILYNIILYLRFKILIKIFLQKKFFREFIYYRFLSILSFKEIGDFISKLYIINKKSKINKSKNIIFVFYEKIFDGSLTLIIFSFALFLEFKNIELIFLFVFIFVVFLNSKIINLFIHFVNYLLPNKLKKKEILHLISNNLNFNFFTLLKVILIIGRYSLLLIICGIDFDLQKLIINFGVFQFLSLISLSPGGIGIFDLLAYKSAELIYSNSEVVIIFVLLNRISTVLGTTVTLIISKRFKFFDKYFINR